MQLDTPVVWCHVSTSKFRPWRCMLIAVAMWTVANCSTAAPPGMANELLGRHVLNSLSTAVDMPWQPNEERATPVNWSRRAITESLDRPPLKSRVYVETPKSVPVAAPRSLPEVTTRAVVKPAAARGVAKPHDPMAQMPENKHHWAGGSRPSLLAEPRDPLVMPKQPVAKVAQPVAVRPAPPQPAAVPLAAIQPAAMQPAVVNAVPQAFNPLAVAQPQPEIRLTSLIEEPPVAQAPSSSGNPLRSQPALRSGASNPLR